MSKQQYNKRFRQQEIILNSQSMQRNKNSYISPLKGARLNSEDSLQKIEISLEKKNKVKNQQYRSQLREQSPIGIMEDEYLTNKSRQIDIDNSNYIKDNYPFGFEGVRVREEVVEKYKASNYTIQKNMLQRFEREAEQFRKNRIKRYRQEPIKIQRSYVPIQPIIQVYQPTKQPIQMRHTQPIKQIGNMSVLAVHLDQNHQKQTINLNAMRRSEISEQKRRKKRQQERLHKLRRQKKSEQYLKKQKENLIKVGNMLKEIDHKIKQNSSKLSFDIQALKNHLKLQSPKQNTPKKEIAKKSRPLRVVNRAPQSSKSFCKVPVVMYNHSFVSNRMYYDDTMHKLNAVNRKDFDSAAEIGQLVSILRKNQSRLKVLIQTNPTEGSNQDQEQSYGD